MQIAYSLYRSGLTDSGISLLMDKGQIFRYPPPPFFAFFNNAENHRVFTLKPPWLTKPKNSQTFSQFSFFSEPAQQI